MKKLMIMAIVAIIFACEPRQGKRVEDVPSSNQGLREIVVQEVLQANSYTYVKATEDGEEIWMAIMKDDIETGKKYYYDQAMEMKNFKSKDLDRTFESVYFLQGLLENPDDFTKTGAVAPNDAMHQMTKGKEGPEQKDINIDLEAGVTAIGHLYENKSELASKTITVKGVVTKYNPKIMNKNWVHIQDGTGDESSFDLTITTLDEVKPGEIVKFEGTVAIDQDFGHGYQYDLLLEDAVLLNKKPDVKIN
jgi:hypothetical protein